ncbi:hypothetical protein HMI55_000934, partial [Coelomomyces lativittatus]
GGGSWEANGDVDNGVPIETSRPSIVPEALDLDNVFKASTSSSNSFLSKFMMVPPIKQMFGNDLCRVEQVVFGFIATLLERQQSLDFQNQPFVKHMERIHQDVSRALHLEPNQGLIGNYLKKEVGSVIVMALNSKVNWLAYEVQMKTILNTWTPKLINDACSYDGQPLKKEGTTYFNYLLLHSVKNVNGLQTSRYYAETLGKCDQEKLEQEKLDCTLKAIAGKK